MPKTIYKRKQMESLNGQRKQAKTERERGKERKKSWRGPKSRCKITEHDRQTVLLKETVHNELPISFMKWKHLSS